MCGCESWTVKKAEHRQIDAFELWCWRRLLRVPWTARRSDQSILKEISPGCSLEGLMLKLKRQYCGHLMWGNWLIWKDPDVGKDWRQEEKGTTEDEMAGWCHWLNGHEFEQAPGVDDGHGSLVCCSPWGCRVRHDWVTEPNWIETVAYQTSLSFTTENRITLFHQPLFMEAACSFALSVISLHFPLVCLQCPQISAHLKYKAISFSLSFIGSFQIILWWSQP